MERNAAAERQTPPGRKTHRTYIDIVGNIKVLVDPGGSPWVGIILIILMAAVVHNSILQITFSSLEYFLYDAFQYFD